MNVDVANQLLAGTNMRVSETRVNGSLCYCVTNTETSQEIRENQWVIDDEDGAIEIIEMMVKVGLIK